MTTRVLVTGATGFIGKYLVSFLLEKKILVRVLVRKINENFFPDGVEQCIGDLLEPDSLINVVKDVDIVFHLGGFAHAWKENSATAEQHKQINLNGTKNILEKCIQTGVKKFIFFSTIKAVADTDICIDETWTEMPNTPYGNAKRAAEEIVLSEGKNNNMHVCVLRLALVYGPRLKGNLYQMLRAIDKGIFLSLPNVTNYRSLVSVFDVCQAAWLASQLEIANGKIYFVTEKESYSTYQIYAYMRKALNLPAPKWHIPLCVFKMLAIIGDKIEKIINRRFPFNSQTFIKLFGSAHCSSKLISKDLGFYSQFQLKMLLPDIVKSYREENLC